MLIHQTESDQWLTSESSLPHSHLLFRVFAGGLEGDIHCLKCALCVPLKSVTCLRMWSARVCIDRLSLQWSITHLFAIGEIGWKRRKTLQLVNSAWRVRLWGEKLSFFFFAFMGFIWHITIPRLRRWSSQRVKWREGRRTGTQTLPPPSLSPLIRFTSSTSQPLNSALLHSPHHGSPYRDLWGHLYRLSGNTEIGFVLFLLSSLFVFAFFNPAFCAWMIDETPRKVFPGPNQGKGGRVLKTKL